VPSDLSKKFVGQHGISKKFVNTTSRIHYPYLDTDKLPGKMELSMDMESEWNFGENLGAVYKGWFVPPTTARYRFYVTCDHKCDLHMAPCADTTSPLQHIVTQIYPTGYRDHFSANNFRETGKRHTWSEWISLEKGKHYYLLGKYVERTHSDHFSVAVEIEQSAVHGHHHAMKEIQEISAIGEVKYEHTRITVTNPDNNKYLLIFTNPKDPKKKTVSS
jgi:hypothetical protein